MILPGTFLNTSFCNTAQATASPELCLFVAQIDRDKAAALNGPESVALVEGQAIHLNRSGT
jgi:hypothetical protein